MYVKTLRGSIFFMFMLIVSVTLSGCSFSIGAIISAITNVIGNLSGKLGGFIEKGLTFAKDFVGKAQSFISPILDAGKAIFKDFAPVAENIQNGFGKVNNIFDTVGNVSNSFKNFTNAISNIGKDSTGNAIDPNAPSNEVVPSPDDEDAVITISPENNIANTNNNNATTEVSTQDVKAQGEQIAQGITKIANGLNTFTQQLQQLPFSNQKIELGTKIKNIKNNLAQIIKDPFSSNAKSVFEQTKNDFNTVIAEAQKAADIAKGAVDFVGKVQDTLGQLGNEIDSSIQTVTQKAQTNEEQDLQSPIDEELKQKVGAIKETFSKLDNLEDRLNLLTSENLKDVKEGLQSKIDDLMQKAVRIGNVSAEKFNELLNEIKSEYNQIHSELDSALTKQTEEYVDARKKLRGIGRELVTLEERVSTLAEGWARNQALEMISNLKQKIRSLGVYSKELPIGKSIDKKLVEEIEAEYQRVSSAVNSLFSRVDIPERSIVRVQYSLQIAQIRNKVRMIESRLGQLNLPDYKKRRIQDKISKIKIKMASTRIDKAAFNEIKNDYNAIISALGNTVYQSGNTLIFRSQ